MKLFLEMCQLIGGLILAFGSIPQLNQIIKTKSVRDINLKSQVNILIGCALMEVYGLGWALNGDGRMFLFTNSLSLLLSFITIYLINKYKQKK